MRVACVVAVLALSCGGTERQRTTYPVALRGSAGSVVTDSGWAVTLSQAKASFVAVRFFEGKAVLARAAPAPVPWWRSALISTAWAHPGHYVPGAALGELLASSEFDLLAPQPTEWGQVDALTGEQGSLQLTWADTKALELSGVATRAGQTVNFSVVLTSVPTVEGVRSERVVQVGDPGLEVVVDLAVVLGRMDFGQVGTGASPLDPASPAYNGLVRGLEDTSAYVANWRQ